MNLILVHYSSYRCFHCQFQRAEDSTFRLSPCEPLSFEEQEALIEAINNLPQRHLLGVCEILRGSAPQADDVVELDIDLDEVDISIQRELQQFVADVGAALDDVAPRRVSDVSESTQQEHSGVTRTEFTELLEMVRDIQNDLADLYEEFL